MGHDDHDPERVEDPNTGDTEETFLPVGAKESVSGAHYVLPDGRLIPAEQVHRLRGTAADEDEASSRVVQTPTLTADFKTGRVTIPMAGLLSVVTGLISGAGGSCVASTAEHELYVTAGELHRVQVQCEHDQAELTKKLDGLQYAVGSLGGRQDSLERAVAAHVELRGHPRTIELLDSFSATLLDQGDLIRELYRQDSRSTP